MFGITRNALRVAVASTLITGAAFAALAQDGNRSADVKTLGNCAGCTFDAQDFSDRPLRGLDLEDAKLSGIAFDRSALAFAIFDGATLDHVTFADSDLRGASFVGARLTNVTFDRANLRGAVFEGAILDGTELETGLLCNTQMPDDKLDNSECD
jgi:uncharacterized protein YjbI with pentapeptide repeats